MADLIRAAIYIRVSTAQQAESGLGLSDQQAAATAYIEANGWQLAEVYADRGVSGRETSRPALDRVLADAEAGKFERLVILRLDRLGRNARGMLEVAERLNRASVGLAAVRDSIDTASPSGRMIFAVLSAMAEYESELIGSRNAAAAGERAKRGQHHGRSPYGYTSNGGKLEPVREQAAIVRRIFREAAAGKPQRQIAKGLSDDGILTLTGKAKWSQATIGTILVNPAYIGKVVFNGEILEGEHKPIIKPDLFEKVGRALDRSPSRNREARGRPPAGRHLFTRGLLRCGLCNAGMTARTDRGGKYEDYRCLTRVEHGVEACDQDNIPRDVIDKAAFEYFARVGLDVDATRKRLTEAAEAATREAADLVWAAERAKRKAEARLDRVRRDYSDGNIEAAEWRELRAGLESERESAEAKLAEYRKREAEIAKATDGAADPAERIARRLDALRKSIAGKAPKSTRDLDAVRAALRASFEQFEVYPVPAEVKVSAAERELAEAAIADLPDVPSVRVDEWQLVPIPLAETIADLEAIAPVLKLRPLDLPDDEDDSGPNGGGGSGPPGGGRGPIGPRADFQKNAPAFLAFSAPIEVRRYPRPDHARNPLRSPHIAPERPPKPTRVAQTRG